MQKIFRAIDLFAGIGGIRLGFQQAFRKHIDFVFSSEIDKFAQKTYCENFGEVPFGDITQIDERQIPQHDIILAGFPCQAFSIAGKRKGFEDTRGTLFFDIVRIAKEHLPQLIFLENVKGFKNHNRGRTFEIVLKTLEELGYEVFYEILNAKNFGVPQNRERIYIVAFSKRVFRKVNFSFNELKRSNIESRVGDILEHAADTRYTISDKLWSGHQKRKEMHRHRGNGFGYSLFDENSKYTSTMSARYYKDGSEILIYQKGSNPRKLTPRESARLQGFPDSFLIPVSDNQSYKQFGNSVAVPVIQKIAETILKELIDGN